MRFWNRYRNRRVAIALLFAYAIAFLVLFATDTAGKSSAVSGDFPAFYTAGLIVSSGRGGELYDFSLQQTLQAQYWTALRTEFHPYAYPPFVAAFFWPFALLPPLVAKLLFVSLQFLCLVGALKLSASLLPVLKTDFWVSLAAALSFAPLLIGIASGQNVALSLLLYAAIVWTRCEMAESRFREVTTGILVAAWLFKPQYGLLMGLYFLAMRRWLVCASAALCAFCLYGLSCAISGANWLALWSSAAREFHSLDLVGNAHQMISLPGFGQAFDLLTDGRMPFGYWTGVAFALLLLIFSAWTLVRLESSVTDGSVARLQMTLWSLGPALVLISPHSLFYDLGICFFSAVAILPLVPWWGALWFLLIVFALSTVRELFPLTPLFICAPLLYLSTVACALLRKPLELRGPG